MSERQTILRFEIRVEQEMREKVWRVIADAGLSAYTCVADECAACLEEVDECLCDD